MHTNLCSSVHHQSRQLPAEAAKQNISQNYGEKNGNLSDADFRFHPDSVGRRIGSIEAKNNFKIATKTNFPAMRCRRRCPSSATKEEHHQI